jgi:hypothetical protein
MHGKEAELNCFVVITCGCHLMGRQFHKLVRFFQNVRLYFSLFVTEHNKTVHCIKFLAIGFIAKGNIYHKLKWGHLQFSLKR